MVEKVQRRASKLVAYTKDDPHESWLNALKLRSLEFRRKHDDMIQVFKILNDIDQIEPDILFQMVQ